MKDKLGALKIRFLQLQKREQVIVTLGIISAMVFLFANYGLKPNIKHILETAGELETKGRDIDIAEAEGADLEMLQQEYDKLEKDIEGFEAKIPQSANVDMFVNDLTKNAVSHGVTIRSIKSGDTQKEGAYILYLIEISLLSDAKGLISFLDAVAAMPRLVGIKEFSIKTEEGLPPKLEVTLKIGTYSMK